MNQPELAPAPAVERELASAYSVLQKWVCGVAFLMPIAVVGVDYGWGDRIYRSSLSQYYYGRGGNVFVGALCALAVFFLSYQYKPMKGFKPDRLWSSVAAALAAAVALCPTSQDRDHEATSAKIVGLIHITCAIALFFLLAAFCLKFFTKSVGEMTDQKKRRNKIYRGCGLVIVINIIAAGICGLAGVSFMIPEVLAIWAFAFAWGVKGQIRGWFADPS